MSKRISIEIGGLFAIALLALVVWLAWLFVGGLLSLTVLDLLVGAALLGIGYLVGRAA
jgi:hypothetical protein